MTTHVELRISTTPTIQVQVDAQMSVHTDTMYATIMGVEIVWPGYEIGPIIKAAVSDVERKMITDILTPIRDELLNEYWAHIVSKFDNFKGDK